MRGIMRAPLFSSTRLHSLFIGLMGGFFFIPLLSHASPSVPAPVLEARAHGFESWRLSNGFRLILLPYPSAVDTRVELAVRTGSVQEGYGETGMAHLLEHLLFKSAGNIPDVKQELTRLGVHWNGTTTPDRTNYFETFSANPDILKSILHLEAARFGAAHFTQNDLTSEMTVVRNELERNDNSPQSQLYRTLFRESFLMHGYGHPTIGARSDIENAPFSALQAFHDKHYRPDNAYLIISGRFDVPQTLELATALFSPFKNPATPKPTDWTLESPGPVRGQALISMPNAQRQGAVAWRIPSEFDAQTTAIEIGLSALCDPDWGSLRKALVLDQQSAASVHCSASTLNRAGLVIASATALPHDSAPLSQLATQLAEHLEKMAAQGLSRAQFERAKKEESDSYERLIPNHQSVAALVSSAESAGSWLLAFARHKQSEQLTLDFINQALKAWIQESARTTVLVDNGLSQAPALPPPPVPDRLLLSESYADPWAGTSDPMPTLASDLARVVQRQTLPNGDQLALLSRNNTGSRTWLSVVIDSGNGEALKGRALDCSMASSLAAAGGGGYNRDQLNKKMAELKTRFTLGVASFSLETQGADMTPAFDILLKAFASPDFPHTEFERTRSALINSLVASQKDPAAQAANVAALRFDNYPDGHPHKPMHSTETLERIKALTLDGAVECKKIVGQPGHLRIAASGPLTLEALVQWDQQIRSQLGSSSIPYERIIDPPPPLSPDTTPIRIEAPAQSNARILGQALLAITDAHPQFPALYLALKALGGDAQSRIWNRLREKDGLAYSAGSQISIASLDPRSMVSFYATATPSKVAEAQQALQEELAQVLSQGFEPAEIERVQKRFMEDRKQALSRESGVVDFLLQAELTGHDYDWIIAYDQRIGAVDATQATQALRTWLGSVPLLWQIGTSTVPAPTDRVKEHPTE